MDQSTFLPIVRFRIVTKLSALLRVLIAVSQNAQLPWQARLERLPEAFFPGKLGRMATITEIRYLQATGIVVLEIRWHELIRFHSQSVDRS